MSRRSRSPAPRAPTDSGRPLSVGIIGAGLGGLTCARVLQSRGVRVKVFEHDLSIEAGRGGEIQLREAESVLRRLGYPSTTWAKLRALSRSSKPYSVPVRALRRQLLHGLHAGTINFGCTVRHMVGTWDERLGQDIAKEIGLFVLRRGDQASQPLAEVQHWDVIIDASGLSSENSFSVLYHNQPVVGDPKGMLHQGVLGDVRWADAHAGIGDARLARRRGFGALVGTWWRNRYGGDVAMNDGLELGQRLGKHAQLTAQELESASMDSASADSIDKLRRPFAIDEPFACRSVKSRQRPTNPTVALLCIGFLSTAGIIAQVSVHMWSGPGAIWAETSD